MPLSQDKQDTQTHVSRVEGNAKLDRFVLLSGEKTGGGTSCVAVMACYPGMGAEAGRPRAWCFKCLGYEPLYGKELVLPGSKTADSFFYVIYQTCSQGEIRFFKT